MKQISIVIYTCNTGIQNLCLLVTDVCTSKEATDKSWRSQPFRKTCVKEMKEKVRVRGTMIPLL
jgi:hypothetical protein